MTDGIRVWLISLCLGFVEARIDEASERIAELGRQRAWLLAKLRETRFGDRIVADWERRRAAHTPGA
jgi:hypothetical protein